MKTFLSRILSLSMALVFAFLAACGLSPSLRTVDTTSIDEKASYTVFLYGGRYSSDIEDLAILAVEGGRYTFEIYSPEYNYKVRKGVPAKDALKMAVDFLSPHRDYYKSIISKILDKDGSVIGYEVRPVYYPIGFGLTDFLDVGYFIKDGKVIVRVNLVPEVNRRLFDGDGIMRKGR